MSQLESAVLKSLLHALVSFCPIKTGICRKYKNNPVKPKFMYNMNVQLLRQAVKNSLEFSKPLPFLCLLQNVFQLLVLIVSTQVANTEREKKTTPHVRPQKFQNSTLYLFFVPFNFLLKCSNILVVVLVFRFTMNLHFFQSGLQGESNERTCRCSALRLLSTL